MDYNWNWGVFFEPSPDGGGTYAQMLVSGLIWTIATALTSWLFASAIGTAIGVARTLPNKLVKTLMVSFVEVFRNIPLLVQLFLWFFVVPELLPTDLGNYVKGLTYAPFITTVVCLTFFTGARVAELVRAGIEAVPRGQHMAATALGLTTAQSYIHIILPNAFRIIFPPLTSEFLVNLKITSVGLTVGLLELTARSRAIQEFTYQVFEAFTAASVLYVAINMSVLALAKIIERRISLSARQARGVA